MPHIYSGYQRALYAYYTNLAMHNAAHIFNHITQILRLGDKIVGEDQLLTQNAAFFKLNFLLGKYTSLEHYQFAEHSFAFSGFYPQTPRRPRKMLFRFLSTAYRY